MKLAVGVTGAAAVGTCGASGLLTALVKPLKAQPGLTAPPTVTWVPARCSSYIGCWIGPARCLGAKAQRGKARAGLAPDRAGLVTRLQGYPEAVFV